MSAPIRIVNTASHDDEIAALDLACFTPEEAHPVELTPECECWVALDGDSVVGYAVAHLSVGSTYLDRYGVASTHAGRGIGKRLLRAWLAWSRRERAAYAWTYTHSHNASSINALIGVGFKAWAPGTFGGAGEPASPRHCQWRKGLLS